MNRLQQNNPARMGISLRSVSIIVVGFFSPFKNQVVNNEAKLVAQDKRFYDMKNSLKRNKDQMVGLYNSANKLKDVNLIFSFYCYL